MCHKGWFQIIRFLLQCCSVTFRFQDFSIQLELIVGKLRLVWSDEKSTYHWKPSTWLSCLSFSSMSILHWAHLRGFASPDLFWSHWIKFSRGPRSKETSRFKSMFIGKAKCLHSILVSLILCYLAYGIIAFWLAGGSAYAKFWLNESFVSILTSVVGVRSVIICT